MHDPALGLALKTVGRNADLQSYDDHAVAAERSHCNDLAQPQTFRFLYDQSWRVIAL